MSGVTLRPRAFSSVCLALTVGLALIAGDARADDQAKAEELLALGRGLMRNRTTIDEACRTLEQSLKLWDRGDTLLNLAECHRRQGKSATAFAEFEKALSVSSSVGFSEAVEAAKARRDDLATKLSTLTVTVAPDVAGLDGFAVQLDDGPWARERWNTAVPVDPGARHVAARAKGYKPFDVRIEVGPTKDAKTVVVTLELEPPPPQLPPTVVPVTPAARPRPVWPWVVGAAGVLFGGAAIASEVVSTKAHSDLDANCGGSARNDCRPSYDFHAARTREVVGYGLFVGLGTASILAIGAAGVGLGLSSRAPAAGASLLISPTSVGVRSTF